MTAGAAADLPSLPRRFPSTAECSAVDSLAGVPHGAFVHSQVGRRWLDWRRLCVRGRRDALAGVLNAIETDGPRPHTPCSTREPPRLCRMSERRLTRTGRLIALCLLVAAVVIIGFAISGALKQRSLAGASARIAEMIVRRLEPLAGPAIMGTRRPSH